MGIFQAPVTPLPTGLDLRGKTVVITGASSGLGLEAARQVLALHASTIVLAVRNTPKGENCKNSLLAHLETKDLRTNPTVTVIELDMDNYQSVQSFASAIRRDFPRVDYLLLNAGTGLLKREQSVSNHERTMQVNYLSNALLIVELLPHLEASAAKSGTSTRITWVGSRAYHNSTLPRTTLHPRDTVIGYMDDPSTFHPLKRYHDSKMLAVMFMLELGPRLNKDKVVINMVCPGFTDTPFMDSLPFYMRYPINILKVIRARTVQQGAWLILNALLIAGEESHGEFILDKDVEQHPEFLLSTKGQEYMKKLYRETLTEMGEYAEIPPGLFPFGKEQQD
ncbi:MAG: hypothetical protein LQ351_007733 [Letrouitia transgressa]|nr:MAG: hypothetical protein LQ351_007733 [Letrouitia transgressa]